MNIRAALYYGYRHRFKDTVNRIAQFEIQLFDGTLRDAYRERYADVYHQAVIAVHLFHARDDAGDVVSRTTYQRLSAEYDVFRFNRYFCGTFHIGSHGDKDVAGSTDNFRKLFIVDSHDFGFIGIVRLFGLHQISLQAGSR